jgi:hypothetical protein
MMNVTDPERAAKLDDVEGLFGGRLSHGILR